MFKPSWQEAMERGERERKAVAYETGPDGRTRVKAIGTGAAADEIIARAQESGVEVRRNAEQVEELLRAEADGETPSIPPEIYELMATVINFAQELNEQWLRREFEPPAAPEQPAADDDETSVAEEAEDE